MNISNPEIISDFERRIQRVCDMIEDNSIELCFLRKSHSNHHHGETTGCDINKEIADLKLLETYLSETRSGLHFNIHFYQTCDTCKYTLPDNTDTFKCVDLTLLGKAIDDGYADKVRDHMCSTLLA